MIIQASDLYLSVISDEDGEISVIGFEQFPVTPAGREACMDSIHEPGSTARFRTIGVMSKDENAIPLRQLSRAEWKHTIANIHSHFGIATNA